MAIDPAALAARRKFMIRCTPDGGLEIKDGNGKKGGNLCGDEPSDLLLSADKTPLRDPVIFIDPN